MTAISGAVSQDERAVVPITVYSDVICPWCYVGKRRLEAALDLLGCRAYARTSWQPFELNPTMPREGMDRKTYLEAKFGSAQAVEAMLDHVREAGRQSGIAFAFDRISRIPNTLDAHRLLWLAHQEDRQDAVVETLFRAYFEEGADLSDRRTLDELMVSAGLSRESVRTCMESKESVRAVREQEQTGLRLGIRAVPHFVVAGQPGLSGAQPPQTLAGWLRQSLAIVTTAAHGEKG